jgi:hypothetical protein
MPEEAHDLCNKGATVLGLKPADRRKVENDEAHPEVAEAALEPESLQKT